MKKYSKESGNKYQKRYSKAYKKAICEEYLKGGKSKRELENKYGLGHSRINAWLKSGSYKIIEIDEVSLSIMTPKSESKKTVEELEKELEAVKLAAAAYKKIIEVAERELNIRIVKK